MIYPDITFPLSWTSDDINAWTAIINRIVTEYNKVVSESFTAPFSIEVTTDGSWTIDHGAALGQATSQNLIKVYIPTGIDWLTARAYSALVAHELGHLALFRKYGDGRHANNLIHYAANLTFYHDGSYLLNGRLWFTFWKLPIIPYQYFNLAKLIVDENKISQAILNGTAPKGSNVYW